MKTIVTLLAILFFISSCNRPRRCICGGKIDTSFVVSNVKECDQFQQSLALPDSTYCQIFYPK